MNTLNNPEAYEQIDSCIILRAKSTSLKPSGVGMGEGFSV